jgi:hypothetical protein
MGSPAGVTEATFAQNSYKNFAQLMVSCIQSNMKHLELSLALFIVANGVGSPGLGRNVIVRSILPSKIKDIPRACGIMSLL